MQRATALYKQLNFNTTRIKSLKKSIRHSLQLIDKLHFDPSLTDRSWVYLSSGKTRNLLEIPEQKREEFADRLIANLKAEIKSFKPDKVESKTQEERQKLTKTISKRRTDLKQEVANENYTEEQRDFATKLLENGLNIDEELPENTDILEGTKAKSIAKKLIELHNARIEKPKFDQKVFERSTVMMESFFKFPLHNEVELEDHDYHAILTGFYKKYFPEYNVKLAVFHGNEKMKGTHDFNKHCHVFLSTLNKETQRYDFLDAEYKRFNEFAAASGLEPLEKRDFEDMKFLGELRQKMFYEHAQAYLNEKKRNIELYFLPETEQRRLIRQLIKKQAKLPKEERLYNQLNYQQEQINKQKAELQQLSEELEQARQEIEQQKAQNEQRETKIIKAAKIVKTKQAEQLTTLAEIQKAEDRLNGITTLFKSIYNWAKAIILNEKEEAKTTKNEIKKQLENYEKDPAFETLQDTLTEAEKLAESIEKRQKIEEMLQISPSIKNANEKVRKAKVKLS